MGERRKQSAKAPFELNTTETSPTEIVIMLISALDLPQNLGLPKILGSTQGVDRWLTTQAVNLA